MQTQSKTNDTNDLVLGGLNPEQYKAVVTPGSMLVLAGAGSGKTRVLSSRIAYKLRTGVQQQNILAVTFTNKAAREMKGRIDKMLGEPAKDLWVGTFHSICNQMLREFGRKIGVDPNFHILDTTDQASMVKRIFKDLSITPDHLKIVGESLNSVVSQISKIKESGGRINTTGKMTMIEEVYVKYVSVCEKEGAMDFSDLILKTNHVLARDTGGIATHYRERFSHILVDEFQDTNQQQYDWLSYIKNTNSELFAVGDDDQSIYAFRGADPESMNKFLKGAAGGNIIRLEQNYRSTGNILNSANSVISNNDNRIGKTLRTSQGSGDKVDVFEFERDNQESGYIASRIKNLLSSGVKHHEIAILYRSNFQSVSLERAMLDHGVPYVIHGGTRFFERQEVKDVLAYVRLAFKPQDDSAFHRVVNLPPRGLGAKSIQPIIEIAKGTDVSCMDVAMDEAHENGGKIQAFTDLMLELGMAMNKMDLATFIKYIIERTGMRQHYQSDDDGENRIKNMEELASVAAKHLVELEIQPENARDAMAVFLSTFTLEDAAQEDSHMNRKKAVTMMTIHSAKGLEFEYVFINGVEEESLPHKNSVDDPGGLQEERRLMYVAITRAKKHLTVTHANSRYVYGKPEVRDPSRFIEEMPAFALQFKKFGSPERPKYGQDQGSHSNGFAGKRKF